MTIERVTINDAEELLKIYAPYVTSTAVSFEYEVPTVTEFAERIKNISAKYPYIKAVEDGKIVGYAYANTFKGRAAYDRAVETTIYLKQDEKRRGLGKALYEVLEKSLADMGITNMDACIASPNVEDEYLNADSIKFHSAMGFEMVGTFKKIGYKFERYYDMVWMEKIIREHVSPAKEVDFGNWKI